MAAAPISAERQNQIDDIKTVMSTKQGRRFMWRLLDEGNVFRDCFSCEVPVMANLLGRRYIALIFFREIMDLCPDQFRLAQKENNKPQE